MQDKWIKAIYKAMETSTYYDFNLKHNIIYKNPIKGFEKVSFL